MNITTKDWGYEICFQNNKKYCGKEITVYKDKWSSNGKFHFHKIKDETFYILKGVLKLVVIENGNEIEYNLTEKQRIRILPGTLHKFTSATLTCSFIETSTTDRDSDSYRVKVKDSDNYKNDIKLLIDGLSDIYEYKKLQKLSKIKKRSKLKKNYKKIFRKNPKIKIGDKVQRVSDEYNFIVSKHNVNMVNRCKNDFKKIK